MKTPTVFSDPFVALEFARRISATPRRGFFARLLRRRHRVHHARIGNETIISDR